MCRFHSLLWILCAAPVGSIFQGTCPKKEAPPGVLVVSPGSSLVLSCDGDVRVDGAKVKAAKRSSDDTDASREMHTSNGDFRKTDLNATKERIHEEGVQRGEQTSLSLSSSFPTHQVVRATVTPLEGGNANGNRGTRVVKGKSKWKWNGETVGRGHRELDSFALGKSGTQLSVTSVRLRDSGNYTCQYKGQVMFSLKVIVADPPEVPRLSCSKKSPSSKIRCDWTPRKPLPLRPNCSLFINKRPSDRFQRVQCSFSSQRSRCWCVLEHNDDELRTRHMAYLCVTNVAGNTTSAILSFSPLDILKPDPPSAVSIQQEVGHQTRMRVNWTFPSSWKSQDSYYELKYELKYQPVDSSPWSVQLKLIKGRRSFTITDAIPGVEYMMQLRTKEEFDGLWSGWSAPVYGSSWIDSRTEEPIALLTEEELMNVTFPEYEGSGTDDPSEALPEASVSPTIVSRHIVWISCLFAILAIILSAYVFRRKEKFFAKVHSLSFRSQNKGPAQPKPVPPIAPESRALVTLNPPSPNEEPPVVEEEDEAVENDAETARTEAIHFNNTTYFFTQSE
ncbi:interleukin-6 receptor subunit alpha [Hippocampus comes]|uniref:Interleukin 6 receptor n=1 Tax=Hippocampus comes TaxID=109280 RepID=A0A3Q3DUN3_HIPCM|nr:PREDICTED: interleukin-6 receptor subunit alpha-like [Hippocampus comes]